MEEFLIQFWASVEKTDGCWYWHGSTLTTGDGITLPRCWPPGSKYSQYAHRVSYELEHGPITDKTLCVCHHCDDHMCVRPDHLFLGTHKDNMADMARKKRAASGERCGASKLTDAKVAEIRQRWNAGEHNKSALGRCYGVSHTMIRHIVNGKYWDHVNVQGINERITKVEAA
jgi:hypothetical protein